MEDERQCAVSMCGVEDQQLVNCCGNGHMMHPECIYQLALSSYPKQPVCPLCRNDTLGRMACVAVPSRTLALSVTPFSEFAGWVAVRIGSQEHSQEKM